MATYDYASFHIYDAGGNFVSDGSDAGQLDDTQGGGLGSNAFTVGETVADDQNNAGVTATLTFAGSVNIGGIEYPVFDIAGGANDGGQVIYAGNDLSGSSPATIPAIDASAFVVCFAAGTEIATAEGVALVEELKVGDMIRTFDGRDVAVKWVGRQSVSMKFGPAERLQPVKVAAGALGADTPSKDLIVTADHALLIGDTLCAAGALVNGTTIARTAELGETFTVYHVETEEHEVIVANGAATETFIDNVSRRAFDNYAEFEAMYGDVAEMEELGYPRATTARQVPAAIRAELAAEKVA